MSYLSGMLGNATGTQGAAGLNYNASAAPILNTTNANQIGTAYTQNQSLINQLGAQNGIQNQSNVYNQLQAQANGQGANPAQAQLAQATGANTANQAALMAGQRGASANTGLMARQAAQQGAANQQNSVGQAATMQAQQSQNALSQLSGLSTQQVNQQMGATMGEQQALLGAAANQNNANVAMQSNINNADASIAGIAAQGQAQIASGITGSAANSLVSSLAKGGEVKPKKYDDGGDVSGTTPTPTGGSSPSVPSGSGVGGKGGGGGVMGLLALMADGGQVSSPNIGSAPSIPTLQMPSSGAGSQVGSYVGKWLKGMFSSSGASASQTPSSSSTAPGDASGGGGGQDTTMQDMQDTPAAMPADSGPATSAASSAADTASDIPEAAAAMAKGGKVPALLSPGERYLPPKEVKKVAEGKKSPMKAGEKIPGKAKVSGDSTKNDIVPKTLTSGGIVLPRSVTEHKNAPEEAKKFVQAIIAKKSLHKRAA